MCDDFFVRSVCPTDIKGGSIEFQRRIEQRSRVKDLVKQRHLVTRGVRREIVEERRKFFGLDAITSAEITINTQDPQGIAVQVHGQVVFTLTADGADEQRVQFGIGHVHTQVFLQPALQTNHALQAVKPLRGRFSQVPDRTATERGFLEAHGIVELVRTRRDNGSRHNTVITLTAMTVDITRAIVRGVRVCLADSRAPRPLWVAAGAIGRHAGEMLTLG